MKRIYLDYASLTPIDRRVLREMRRYSGAEYANPSSIYREGAAARKAMDDGRKRVGEFLHAHPDEIVFTSGGTEANVLAFSNARGHVITSAIEHSSVMETANGLEKRGIEVTRLPVDSVGGISPDDLRKAIRPDTALVSIMTVNNETGSVMPIREIAKAIRHARANTTKTAYPLFHTDAAQAAACLDLNVEKLGIDLLTLDGNKVYGPRGIGALYVRRGTPLEPVICGGGQERGLRSGTENLPAVMGFARALDIAAAGRESERERLHGLRDFFIAGLKEIDPGITVNSPEAAPHILNVSIPGIDNEMFVLRLDARGVACSTKSSCLRDADGSYVLKAVGADSRTSVRFSFGRATKRRDLAKTLHIIDRIRKI